MSAQCESEVSVGEAVFGHAQLGDRRRTARLVDTFELMRRHPGGTLPDKLASPADLRAFYRLCDAEDVTHAAVIEAARQYTLRRIAEYSGPVLICPPHAKHGIHGDDPLAMFVVLVTEVNPPAGEKPIEWMLLTNDPVQTISDACRVIEWYEKRWIVEELHKAMKTGCRIEDMQFTTTCRQEPAIALLSVVAVTLLNLRDASRREDAKTRLASTLLSPDYVTVLSQWRYRNALGVDRA